MPSTSRTPVNTSSRIETDMGTARARGIRIQSGKPTQVVVKRGPSLVVALEYVEGQPLEEGLVVKAADGSFAQERRASDGKRVGSWLEFLFEDVPADKQLVCLVKPGHGVAAYPLHAACDLAGLRRAA